jgi:hypothetical protein
MNNLLSEISKLLDKQTNILTKRFDKLDKRVNNIRDRVTKLERKERVKKTKVTSCQNATQFDDHIETEQLQQDLSALTYLEANKVDRSDTSPKYFVQFVNKQFEKQENCNLHLKGTRLYEYVDGTWSIVSNLRGYLDRCRTNLWEEYNRTFKTVFEHGDSWDKVFGPIHNRNKSRKCPMSHSSFRRVLTQAASFAAENRGVN